MSVKPEWKTILDAMGYVQCSQCGRAWRDDVDFTNCDCGFAIYEYSFPVDWDSLNRERGELIDRRITSSLTEDERDRLDLLTIYCDERISVIPQPKPPELPILGDEQ